MFLYVNYIFAVGFYYKLDSAVVNSNYDVEFIFCCLNFPIYPGEFG